MRRWVIDLLGKQRVPIKQGDIHTIGPECFGTGWPDDFPEVHGCPTVICYRGENYVLQKPTLRVRLHNWLVSKERVFA
jgi:hypothetical protein